MTELRFTNACVRVLAALLVFAGVPAIAAPRVAVIPVDGDDAPKLAPLIEIALEKSGITLVERAQLDRVIQEQKLQALLSADSPGARAKLGQLLNANFLVFISCPEKPTRRLEVITCETTQGIRLARTILPRAESAEKDADAANDAISKAIAKSAKAGLKLIAVAPWSSDDLTTQFDYRRAAFRRLAEEPLADRDDIVLVEFAEAEALQTELAIAGQPNLNRKEPLILSGKMKHSSVSPDAQVTVGLELTRGNQTLGTWSSGQVDVSAAAAALPAASADLVNKAAGDNPAMAPALQAKELADRADRLQKLSFYSDAAEMYEAALLLDPDDTAYHIGAARSLYLKISQDLALQGPDNDPFDRLAHAARVIAPSCDPLAERCLQHMEFVYEHTVMSNQFFMDFDFTGVIARFVPNTELWDSTVRVMAYKHAQGVDDAYASHVLRQVIDSTVPGYDKPGLDYDQAAAFIMRLTDVCTAGAPIGYFLEWRPMPRLASILSHMEHSDNPVAVSAAKQFNAYEAKKNYNRLHPKTQPAPPAPPGPQVDSDFRMVRMKLPIEKSYNGLISWSNAGPHADLIEQCVTDTTRGAAQPYCLEFYCLRDDGFVRNLGHYVRGTPPGFDGKYVWWVAVENHIAVVKAYDPDHDKLWTAGAANGVPPDEVISAAVTGASPGSAYIIGSIGPAGLDPDESPTRTWLAAAKMDTTAGPSLTMIHEWRERAILGKTTINPGAAFDCDFINLMPGPPGAKKPVPKLYIGGVGRPDMFTFLVDPTTGDAALVDDDHGFRYSGIVFHDKLYRPGPIIFDPATNKATDLPLPAPLAGSKDRIQAGPTVWNDKMYYFATDKDVGYLWTYQGQTPTKPIIGIIDHPPQVSAYFGVFGSSVLGLVESTTQLQLLHPNSHPEYQSIDWRVWLQKHADQSHDPQAYLGLTEGYERGSDAWLASISSFLKYDNPGSLERAHQAVRAAGALMEEGEYIRAADFADVAAKSRSEWGYEFEAWAEEGQGKWTDAEKNIRRLGDIFGKRMEWLAWCARTDRGDLPSARAAAQGVLQPRVANLNSLQDEALFYLYTGDDAKAQPILKQLYEQMHDPWAALHAAIYAGDRGENKTRDAILADWLASYGPAIDHARDSNPFVDFAAKEASSLTGNSPLTDQELQLQESRLIWREPKGIDDAGIADLQYFAGRILIFQGQTDRGIKRLLRAAGCNSCKSGRTLAAMYLRAHHIEVPKPGMDQ